MALGQSGGWPAAKGLTVINGRNRDVINLDAPLGQQLRYRGHRCAIGRLPPGECGADP